MQEMKITFPAWIEGLPKKDRARARVRFILRLAAILATQEGSISVLSQRIGMHKNTLNTMIAAGVMDNGVPVHIIKAIEKVIGVGVIPRSVLNPEVYGDM